MLCQIKLYTQSSKYMQRFSNYIINDSQDELISYDSSTNRILTHRNSKTRTLNNYIIHGYTNLSDQCIRPNYRDIILLGLTNINIIHTLINTVHSYFGFTYTDKAGETHNMVVYIKSYTNTK